jgi:hypothetical protein
MRAFGAPVNSGVRLGLLPFATQLDGALPLPRFLAGVRARGPVAFSSLTSKGA